MQATATAVYERGTLRLRTPLGLPERARMRIQILEAENSDEEKQRVEAALVASGLVKPLKSVENLRKVSRARRAELAKLYSVGGPVSEIIITERVEQQLNCLPEQVKCGSNV